MASVSGVGSTSSSSTGSSQSIADMTSKDFLQLLITELSNQDPFEPMKNKEILEQLSAIRSLESNMTMSENFTSLIDNQQMVSATTLIGRTVIGVDTQGTLIEGQVESIVLDASGIRLTIGDRQMVMKNVMQIIDSALLPAAAQEGASA